MFDWWAGGDGRGVQLSQSQQTDMSGSSFYATADTVFTALFTVELLLNMAAHLLRPFLRDPWNWFDTVRGRAGGPGSGGEGRCGYYGAAGDVGGRRSRWEEWRGPGPRG
jgi:hypothetical protein